jgi:hypothetical protein
MINYYRLLKMLRIQELDKLESMLESVMLVQEYNRL